MNPYSLFLLLPLFTFLIIAPSSSLATLHSLTPPPGNSLAFRYKTRDAVQLYRCIDGDWVPGSAYATLVDVHNPSKIVGNFSFVPKRGVPKYAGTWVLLNRGGDSAESGFSYSTVSGKRVFTAKAASPKDLPEYITRASSHQYDGAAFLVSYIARVNTNGGVPPNNGYCEWDYKVIKVRFDAEFDFWKQDLIPPSTPSSLAVTSGRPVQSFFGIGVVTYIYSGHNWTQKNSVASLYDVPGGTKMGNYYIRSGKDNKGGSSCWEVSNPNGFTIVGRPDCKPVQVSPGCLPWSLSVVTTSAGNSTVFGQYTQVQTVSTTGGLPPAKPAWMPHQGQIWKAAFTAIYWIFCEI